LNGFGISIGLKTFFPGVLILAGDDAGVDFGESSCEND
jgi:hypothetical protein